MAQEIERLFNYKGREILLKKVKGKYCVGVRDKFVIWFENTTYDSLKIARVSGREYARIIIDKFILLKLNKKGDIKL